MNMKLASRLVYILLLVALGFTITLKANHLPKAFVFSTLITLTCIYFILRLVAIRKKARAAGNVQSSGIHKISDAILIASPFGTMVALMLMIWHVRYIGLPLLNYSLVMCILGFCLKLFAKPRVNNDVITIALKRRQAVTGTIIYLCVICIITGMLLRINHFSEGRLLMNWGTGSLFAFLAFLIIYAAYLKKRKDVRNPA